MNMQSHEWVSVQQVNERINDFHRQAEAERLANIARANKPEAARISFQQVADYVVASLKQVTEPKPAPQHKVLVRNQRRTV